jgi:hypothetical protein
MRGIVGRLVDWFHVSDEEHVERVRRALASHDRWRWGPVLLYGSALIGLVGVYVAWIVLLRSMFPRPGLATAGFLIGAGVGTTLGFLTINAAHGLVDILCGFRNERLMIAYHDALEALRHDRNAGPPAPARR